MGVGMEGVVVPNSDVEMSAVGGALNAERLKERPGVGAAMPEKRDEISLIVDGVGAVEEEEEDPKEKPLEAAGAGALSAEGAPKREKLNVDGAGAVEEEEDPKEKPLEAAGAGAFAAEDTEIEAVDPDV